MAGSASSSWSSRVTPHSLGGERHVLAHRQPRARLGVARERRHEVAGRRPASASAWPAERWRGSAAAASVRSSSLTPTGASDAVSAPPAMPDVDLARARSCWPRGSRPRGRCRTPAACRRRGCRRQARAEHGLAGEVEVAAVLEHGAGDDLAEPLAGRPKRATRPSRRRSACPGSRPPRRRRWRGRKGCGCRRERRQPDPLRPPDGAYAKASNQDMLTAALEGLVARHGLAGERIGEVAAGAVIRTAATSTSPARPSSARACRRDAGLDVSRPGAPASRRRSSWPTRSPSARSTPASPAAPTSASDAPIAVTEGLRASCCGLNRAKTPGSGARRWRGSPARPPGPRGAAQHRAAHRVVDGRAHGESPPSSGASPARPRTTSPLRPPPEPRRRLRPRLLRRPRHAVPRADPRREPARRTPPSRSSRRSSRCSARGGRDDDGRQLDTAHRRRVGRAARLATSGRPRTAWRRWRPGRRTRPQRSTTCTGNEGLLMAPAYAVPRAARAPRDEAPGLRPRRDPRGLRRDRAHDPGRLGGRGVLPRAAGAGRRRSGPSTARGSTSTVLAGRRTPVRRDRRADRRHAGEDVAREGTGLARPDLDLRRRGPGRRGDPRGGLDGGRRRLRGASSTAGVGKRLARQARAAPGRSALRRQVPGRPLVDGPVLVGGLADDPGGWPSPRCKLEGVDAAWRRCRRRRGVSAAGCPSTSTAAPGAGQPGGAAGPRRARP